MDHDERERRDWPEEDRGEPAPEPDWTPAASAGDEPEPSRSDEAAPAGADPADPWGREEASGQREQPADTSQGAPAEIESWPSQEATAGSGSPWSAEPSAEPSTAGDEAWPAEPERADEPSWPSEERPAAWSAEGTGEPSEATAWESPRDAGMADADQGRAHERAPQEVEAYPAAAGSSSEAGGSAAPAHTVPDGEATTGESTQCPRCGTENRPGLSFCRNCGQRLVAAGASSTVERPGTPEGTMACPRCGTHNRAGVAFCQNCGANLRGTAEGYVPPAAASEEHAAPTAARRGAVLGPVVLLIGLAGIVTGYLLPFLYGARDSLFDRAWGAGGYGIAFWNGYPDVNASLADQAYFGLSGPIPLLGLLLLALAVAGFLRAAPGPIQAVGLVVALLWSVGLIVLFVIVELAANWGGDLVGVLRVLTPAGIIFFLSSLIVLIGTLTRFSRG